jgi:DNA-binding MurR/RpiR family transcriptional regulator
VAIREVIEASRHFLANSDDIALSSMWALAATCSVTPPTMLRLARRLGTRAQPFIIA